MEAVISKMRGLRSVYREAVPDELIGGMTVMLLSRYSEQEIVKAIQEVAFVCRQFPTVADFARLIDSPKDLEDEASAQWMQCTAPDGKPSDLSKKVARELFGVGWVYDLENLKSNDAPFRRRDFMDTYRRRAKKTKTNERQIAAGGGVKMIGGSDDEV